MPTTGRFVIDAVYNGPGTSANGGFACGAIAVRAAEHVGGSAAVVLHAPPPLDTVLELRPAGRRVHVWAGEELIATATAAGGSGEPPAPVGAAEALAAEDGFTGDGAHPFPGCYVCGVTRSAPGLFLRPGPVPGRPGTAACTWTPDAKTLGEDGGVRPEVVWSALDCPGGWAGDPAARPAVVGRMQASLHRLPEPHRRHVLVGAVTPGTGRTIEAATALYTETGELLATASTIWVALDGAELATGRG